MVEADLAEAVALREVGGELAEEEVDVILVALAQGGHLDLDAGEAVVEVLAELAHGHGVGEVDVGGGDHAHVRLLHLGGADLHVFAVLQHAQQQRLRLLGELADLVEEEGAAVGLLEIALALADRAGEGALLVAEELGVDGAFGDGAAVDGQVFPGPAAAVLVDDLGDVLLADAALACDQDGQVRGGHGDGRLQGTVQPGIVADDVEFIFEALELLHFHNKQS